jgi:carboxypeptidase Taq
LKDLFKEQLAGTDIELFYKGINKVQPSLIRTEADEITYHFHVMIRYEIEKLLIEGSITAKDIPVYWNEHYKKYLGVTVPNDKLGCLQDIHWSHGSFGYFATYSLGSLYASQLFDAIKQNDEQVEQRIAKGDQQFILDWLRKNIHQFGRQFTSEDLCKKATGKTLDSNYFIQYVDRKFNNIYKF